MLRNQLKSFGAKWELYFENRTPNAFGSLLRGGVSKPVSQNDWWDIRKLRTRPNYVLSIMQENGAGSYRNENGFECQLSYGNFILNFPELKQTYSPGKDEYWHELYVGFSGEIFDSCRNNGIIHPSQPVWHLKNPAPWIKRLRLLLQAPRPQTAIGVTREAAEFLAFLSQMLERATPVEHGAASSDWFSHACILLTNNINSKVNLRDIAAEMGMSYSTFRLYFSQRAGMPPARYRDEQRMKMACELLIKSNKPCRVIAANVGYCSEQYFSTFFKAHVGIAPSEYRKEHQG